MRGSPPIPLGLGMAGSLSPDGKWATTIVSNAHLLLLPTGAGTARQIDQSDIQQYWQPANWTPDGKQIVFSGNRAGHSVQCFVQDAESGKPRPVTPEGVIFCLISPDGKLIAGNGLTGGGGWLYPIEGGQPRPIPGLQPGESFAWTSDPRWLYVYQWKQLPVTVYRLNILNGQRQFFREMTPPDVAGLHDLSHIHFSSDGRAYVLQLHSPAFRALFGQGTQIGSRSRPFVIPTREQRETGGIRFRPTYALNSHLSPSSTGSRILSSPLSSTSAGMRPTPPSSRSRKRSENDGARSSPRAREASVFFSPPISTKESQRAIWSHATGASQGLRDCEYPKSPGVAHSKRKRPI